MIGGGRVAVGNGVVVAKGGCVWVDADFGDVTGGVAVLKAVWSDDAHEIKVSMKRLARVNALQLLSQSTCKTETTPSSLAAHAGTNPLRATA